MFIYKSLYYLQVSIGPYDLRHVFDAFVRTPLPNTLSPS